MRAEARCGGTRQTLVFANVSKKHMKCTKEGHTPPRRLQLHLDKLLLRVVELNQLNEGAVRGANQSAILLEMAGDLRRRADLGGPLVARGSQLRLERCDLRRVRHGRAVGLERRKAGV